MNLNPKPGPIEAPIAWCFYPSVADIPLRFSATLYDEIAKQDVDEYINNEFEIVFRVPVNGASRLHGKVVVYDGKNYTLKIVYHKPKR